MGNNLRALEVANLLDNGACYLNDTQLSRLINDASLKKFGSMQYYFDFWNLDGLALLNKYEESVPEGCAFACYNIAARRFSFDGQLLKEVLVKTGIHYRLSESPCVNPNLYKTSLLFPGAAFDNLDLYSAAEGEFSGLDLNELSDLLFCMGDQIVKLGRHIELSRRFADCLWMESHLVNLRPYCGALFPLIALSNTNDYNWMLSTLMKSCNSNMPSKYDYAGLAYYFGNHDNSLQLLAQRILSFHPNFPENL